MVSIFQLNEGRQPSHYPQAALPRRDKTGFAMNQPSKITQQRALLSSRG